MPRTAMAEPGVDSSDTKTQWSRIASLTSEKRLADIQIPRSKFVEEHVLCTVGGR